MSDHDDLVAAGLYEPDAPDAAERLELLEYLLSLGITIPELRQAEEDDRMLSFAAFRLLRPSDGRQTLAEAAGAAGLSRDRARSVWRAAGFADPRPFERRFGPADVSFFAFVALLGSFLGDDVVLQFVRTLGEAMRHIAEAEVALMRSNVEAPLVADRQWAQIARAYVEIANDLFPRAADALDTLHRHHLEVIGRRYSDAGSTPTAANVVDLAVGFADLSDYTGISQRLDPHALGAMLTTFETVTGDVIAAAGAHVVKRIGDEVMFVTSAPGVACTLALELIDACGQRGLPRLRVGVAFGEVIVRQGDFHGPTVNLAARLVAAASPGVVLTDRSLRDRLARLDDRYVFHPTGRLHLSGYDEPVDAYQLLPARPPGRR